MLAEWQLGEVFLGMLYFFLFFIWIWLLISIFADIFRSHDIGGFAKALWVLFVIIAPFLGILIYLIVRGGKMQERNMDAAQKAAAAYGGTSTSEELARLADLKDRGVIDDAEFATMKAKLVS